MATTKKTTSAPAAAAAQKAAAPAPEAVQETAPAPTAPTMAPAPAPAPATKAPGKAPDPEAKRAWLVGTVPILHDGQLYGVGYSIELTNAQAASLDGLLTPIPE